MRFGGSGFQTVLVVAGTLALTACNDAATEQVQPAPTEVATTTCMPDPSACGYPDAGTVGVTAGTSLAPMSGVVTLNQPGQVLENKLVTGSIAVTAQNVTIRNVRLVVSGEGGAGIGVKPGNNWDRTDANLLVDHVEIDLNGKPNTKGIAFNGYTLRKVFMRNGADCAHFSRNVRIEDSLCAVGPDADRDGVPDAGAASGFCRGTAHFDGFQYAGGADVVINHNTVLNPCEQTSAMLITNDPGFNSPIRNVAVTNNLMAGGGYTLYCADSDDTVESETVVGNRFARTYFPRGGRYGPTAYCNLATTFTGNVWDGSEALIPGSGGVGGGDGADGGGGDRASAPTGAARRLLRPRARRVTRIALRRQFGPRYTRHAKQVRMRCGRRGRMRIVCKVKWKGGDRYAGSVAVRRLSAGSYRYKLKIRNRSTGRLIKHSGKA